VEFQKENWDIFVANGAVNIEGDVATRYALPHNRIF
jgi:hypothetical protein